LLVLGVSFVVIIVISLVILASMKEEVLTMSKLRNIYLYLVSFVALMMILIGLIFTVQNITDVLFPTNYYYAPIPAEKTSGMTEEELKKIEEENKINEQNQKMNYHNQIMVSKKNVAKSVAVVIVALPTFAYHWRKIEKEKKEQA
jgi:Co/Zn/Cd efflux system component